MSTTLQMKPATPPADTDERELPDDQRELLTLLADGLSDQAIGRRLGISRRTVQRRVRTLMDTHGVRTRFQLGIHTAKLLSTMS